MLNNCFGAIAVIAGALYIGISKAREERRKELILRDLCSLLELIKNEICAEKTSLIKLFSIDRFNEFGSISNFTESIRNNLLSLGEKRFCDIWCESIRESINDLPEKSKCALFTLGNSLGKYDGEIQKGAIERCALEIQNEYEQISKTLKNNEKMYIGLGGGAGLIIALMLI